MSRIIVLFLSLFIMANTYAENSDRKQFVAKEEGYYQDLFYRLYSPKDQEIKASLLIIHGMQEHSGRYEKIALFFAEKGYLVLSYDHKGHGKTVKNEENFGYFRKNNPGQLLIDDAKIMAEFLQEKAGNIPHFALGHSMGSFVLRSVLQDSCSDFQAAIIVGTGSKNILAKPAKAYLKMMNGMRPYKRSAFLNTSFGKMNNKKFKNDEKPSSTSWLSLSLENQEAFKKDSLSGIPFTYNGFLGLLSVNTQATKRKWAKNISRDFPMLFLSGADDPIGNYGKGIKKTVKNLEKEGFQNIDMFLYENMRHEILNEAIQDEVFDAIYEWLEKSNSNL